MTKIIAISGKLGSGKDFIAGQIQSRLPDARIVHLAFADHIRLYVSAELQVPITSLMGRKTQAARLALQAAGTRGRTIHPNFWIRVLQETIELRKARGEQIDYVLITDCRFQNEAAWVQESGGFLLRILAPNRNKAALEQETGNDPTQTKLISEHPSETDLDTYKFVHVVHNDPGDDWQQDLTVFLQTVM